MPKKYFAVKCKEGWLVGKNKKPIMADKAHKSDLKHGLGRLKKKNPRFKSCNIVDVSDKVKGA